MNDGMTSRERMLAALECDFPDHAPCAFMMFKGLKSRCTDYREFLDAQGKLGLDVVVELPIRQPLVVNDHYNLHGLPVNFDPRVQITEQVERLDDGKTLLVKEYVTPGGTLQAEIEKPSNWPYGEHVPFLDDYIIPCSRKVLVECKEDLDALRYLLVPPTIEEITIFQQESQPYLELAGERGLLVSCGWGVGADLVGWICGLKNLILMTYRQPDLLQELLNLIAVWNRGRMAALFTLPVDLFVKRAWYENCDFWAPATWRKFILPILDEDVRLAHEAGVKFGYILTSKAMPLIDMILEAGVDVLIGVDPREYDLEKLAALTRGKLALWGGVNGHLTVETGSPQDVEREVNQALQLLAPQGGFILSPVDNIREYSPQIKENVQTLIDSWKTTWLSGGHP